MNAAVCYLLSIIYLYDTTAPGAFAKVDMPLNAIGTRIIEQVRHGEGNGAMGQWERNTGGLLRQQ